ncbi:hypothetical protein QUA81_09735 [Microcoleus sp. F6_B4]
MTELLERAIVAKLKTWPVSDRDALAKPANTGATPTKRIASMIVEELRECWQYRHHGARNSGL